MFELLRKIKSLGYLVKLDTNGYRPDILRATLEEKLVDYVAMDIKNSPAQYGTTTGLLNLDLKKIEESLLLLMKETVAYERKYTNRKTAEAIINLVGGV